jgi:putative hydroxymethylpyrimidine transport system permease protein
LRLKYMINIKGNLPAIALMAAIVFIWEIICRAAQVPDFILPAPSSIIAALIENRLLLLEHTAFTLSAVVGGLLLAIIAALVVAIAMDRWKLLKGALYPLLVISQSVPIFALAPLLLIWFGAGLLPKVFIVTLVCFFPLAVNLVEGFSQVDTDALELMQVIKADRLMIMRSVQLPSTLPYFFSGLKIAATYSVLGAIIGEWLAARAGLGLFMLRSMHSFRTTSLFASIVVVVVLSLALFKLVELGAWLAMPWQRNQENQMEVE